MKKLALLFLFAITLLCSVYVHAQRNILFYSSYHTTGITTDNTTLKPIGNQLNFARWSHVVDIGNGKLLFYNSETGLANTTTKDIVTISTANLASGWTNVVNINDEKILFYNANSGAALLTDNKNFTTLATPNFSGWTHIRAVNRNLLVFYNTHSGLAVVTNNDFGNIIQAITIQTGYTNITPINNGTLLFYNSTTGSNMLVSGSSLDKIKELPLSRGWSIIESIDADRVLFYNATNLLSVSLNNSLSKELSRATLSEWTHIVPFNRSAILEVQNGNIDAQPVVDIIQNTNLTQIKGTIKNESKYNFSFTNGNNRVAGQYLLSVYEVREKPKPTDGNTIVLNNYEVIKLVNTPQIAITQINSKEFNYIIYNLPLNKKLIVNIYYRNMGTDHEEEFGTQLRTVAVVGAHVESYPKLQFGLYGAYINSGLSLSSTIYQNITIKNRVIVIPR